MESENSRSRSVSPVSGSSSEDGHPRGRGKKGRGRGRGRGGRGRIGRGRGQRQGGATGPNRALIAEQQREERERNIVERVNAMDLDAARSVLLLACRRQPSFVFNLLEEDGGNAGGHPNPQPDVLVVPNWCQCSHCREMPPGEQLCCNQNPQNCYSRLPDFSTVVLDELVLEVAMRYRDDILRQPADADYNRSHRHAAYRQFILWIHGYLGAGNRRVIPSCCLWRIRDKYPDPLGHYVGFIAGRLG